MMNDGTAEISFLNEYIGDRSSVLYVPILLSP